MLDRRRLEPTGGRGGKFPVENIRFKLISAGEPDLFEQRLHAFVDSLDRSAVVVDVKYGSAPLPSGGVEYSALVHYQQTESWS